MVEITNFLERIAKRQSSFVIFADRIYDIGQPIKKGTQRKDNKDEKNDSLNAVGMSFTLEESLSLSEFERFDEISQKKEIEEYCADYVKKAINKELKGEEDLEKERNKIQTLRYIMTEFLPFLISKKYEAEHEFIQEFMGLTDEFDPLKLANEEIEQKLLSDFGKTQVDVEDDPVVEFKRTVINRERIKLKTEPLIKQYVDLKEVGIEKTTLTKSALGDIIDNQILYILNNQVYALTPKTQALNSQLVFKINGTDYVPTNKPISSLSRLTETLDERKKLEWRINALERGQDVFEEIRSQIKKNEVTESQMKQLAGLEEYDLGVCGFVMKDQHYYVYARISKFATQDGRNKDVFWPFESTRVAIRIGWQKGSAYTVGKAVVVEKREHHPCLAGRKQDGGFYGICNLNRNEGDYENTPLDMVKKLSDAVNAVTHPLNKPSLDAHAGGHYFGDHLDVILTQGSLTRDEAITNGYQVIEVLEREQTG